MSLTRCKHITCDKLNRVVNRPLELTITQMSEKFSRNENIKNLYMYPMCDTVIAGFVRLGALTKKQFPTKNIILHCSSSHVEIVLHNQDSISFNERKSFNEFTSFHSTRVVPYLPDFS